MSGKQIRMNRIFKEDGKTVISALDFGAFNGSVKGLEDPRSIVTKVVDGGADGLIMAPGFAKSTADIYSRKAASIVRVTGGVSKFGPNGFDHTLMISVQEAVALGADAVMNMIFVGSPNERAMFEQMRYLREECNKYGMVLFTELLPADWNHQFDYDWIDSCVRLGYEFGADAVKTYISNENYDKVIKNIPIPVVMAGGPKTANTFDNVSRAMAAGAAGVAIGRNIYEADDPQEVVSKLVGLVHSKGEK